MGGKNKNKKKKAQTPESLKEQANTAFNIGDYNRAISLYTAGLEMDPESVVLLTNRAAAYIKLHREEEAIIDATRASEIDPGWVKSYLRLAVAYRERSDYENSLRYIEEGLSKDPSFEQLQTLREEVTQELNAEMKVPLDHPERVKFNNLVDWLGQGGSTFPKLSMRFYSEDYRGVHASTHISKNECILYVPKSHIITLEMAKQTPIGSKMHAANLSLLSPKHCFLSSYMLQERRKPDSFWKPYLEILPQHFRSFPIFYDDEEKQWLEGSPFLKQVREKLDDIQRDYNTICHSVPEFAEFPIAEFSKIRMGVSSRIFGMKIDGVKTDGFVPFADMLNHKRPRQTSWSYEQDKGGFVIEAIEDIERGEEVMDSYGKKCNSRFLLNYGFIVRNNDANEYPFKIYLNEEDPLYNAKQGLLEGKYRGMRVQAHINEESFHQFLGLVRVVVLKDSMMIPMLIQECQDEENNSFRLEKVYPISVQNEKDTLTRIKEIAMNGLSKYPTSLDEDDALLRNGGLTENNENCVLMRKGEKEILHWFVKLADICLPLFDLPKKDIKKAAKNNPYDVYITRCIIPLGQ